MTGQLDAWESYFYPETYDRLNGLGVMRNLASIHSHSALRDFEYRMTGMRARELADHPELVPHTYDADHVRAIHRYLFQDVYEWAGQYRSVDMTKGMSDFATVSGGRDSIDAYLDDVHRIVAGTRWDGLDHEQFSQAIATVYAYENQAHPFREGNGRTGKKFLHDVAAQSRFELNFSLVSPKIWNNLSEFSGPDMWGHDPHPEILLPAFQRVAIPRPEIVQLRPSEPTPPDKEIDERTAEPDQEINQQEPRDDRADIAPDRDTQPDLERHSRIEPQATERQPGDLEIGQETANATDWDHQQAEVAEDRGKDVEFDRRQSEQVEDRDKDTESERHDAEAGEDRDKDQEADRTQNDVGQQRAEPSAGVVEADQSEHSQLEGREAAAGVVLTAEAIGDQEQAMMDTYNGPRDSRQAVLAAQGRDLDQVRQQDRADPAAREDAAPVYQRPDQDRQRGIDDDRGRQSGRDYGSRSRRGGPEQDLRRDEVRNPRSRREPADRPYRRGPERGGRQL